MRCRNDLAISIHLLGPLEKKVRTQTPPKDPKKICALTDAACRFIGENKTKPFFAYIAHHAVHSKLQVRPETLARFEKKG